MKGDLHEGLDSTVCEAVTLQNCWDCASRLTGLTSLTSLTSDRSPWLGSLWLSPKIRQKLENGRSVHLPFRDMMESMEAYTTRLEKSGRILIPAAVRRRLGLTEGSQVVVRVEETGTVEITSRSQALAKVREEIRKYIPVGRDLADELIQDRRAEVEREEQRNSRL